MKKIFSVLLTLCMLLSAVSIMSVVSYASAPAYSTDWYTKASTGTGDTESNPYILNNVADLEGLAKLVNSDSPVLFEGKFLKLSDNFDNAGTLYTSIANGLKVEGSDPAVYRRFAGTFDGNGKRVKLNITEYAQDGCDVYGGLFGYANKNSLIKNVNTSGTVTLYGSDFKNCHINAGGIVGFITGTILNCSSDVNTASSCSSSKKVDRHCGGIAGLIYKGSIINCCSTGFVSTVSEKTYTGGIAGQIQGSKITNCYFAGIVGGDGSLRGGVAGFSRKDAGTIISEINQCYFLQTSDINKDRDITTYNEVEDVAITACSAFGTDMLISGTKLVDLLNNYANSDEGVAAGCRAWETVSGVNNGYPVLKDYSFNDKKVETITKLDTLDEEFGTVISYKLIKNTKSAIENMKYDESKTVDENIAAAEAMYKSVEETVMERNAFIYSCPFMSFMAQFLQPIFRAIVLLF